MYREKKLDGVKLPRYSRRRKRNLSPEGRQRISDAQKRRQEGRGNGPAPLKGQPEDNKDKQEDR
jgi:hypothetical protein